MIQERQPQHFNLKETFQLLVARVIAGQEFTLFNSVLIRLAGKEIQPISMDEIHQLLFLHSDKAIKEMKVYDEDNMGPSVVGLFGLSINKVSESLHFTRPFLSEKKIHEAREVIVRAVEEYEKLKSKLEEIDGIRSALFFLEEVENIEKSMGLKKLQDYLNRILLDQDSD